MKKLMLILFLAVSFMAQSQSIVWFDMPNDTKTTFNLKSNEPIEQIMIQDYQPIIKLQKSEVLNTTTEKIGGQVTNTISEQGSIIIFKNEDGIQLFVQGAGSIIIL